MVRLVTFLTALLVLVSTANAQPEGGSLRNPDFAADALGKPPAEWMALPPGTSAKVVEDDASPTKRSVQLGPALQGQQVANLMQQCDARGLRGKRIIVRADVRLAPHENTTQLRNARAQMWVRVDREGGKQGFFDNMADRPIRGLRAIRFQTYAISGVVNDDASLLNIGVMTFGETVTHVARVRIDVVDAAEDHNAPARPLDDRGLTNLTALARLYGYVRYFHPSDEAQEVNWESFLGAAAERVEDAPDDPALAHRLRELFAPIAPGMQVWSGSEADAPAAPPAPESPSVFLAWKHHGVDLAGDSQPAAMQIYTSKRVRNRVDNAPPDVPAPGASVVKRLADGVWCRVPVTLYADADGHTLPRADGAPVALARPEWWSPNGNDRNARLAGVMVAWNVFQHFYPYFDVCDADWDAELTRSLRAAASDADERAYLRTLQRLVAALDDGHGNVAPLNMPRPAPLDAVFDWVGDQLVVARAGPSATGVQAGDVVMNINGVPVAEWYRDCRERISAATEQWARWRAASDHSFFEWSNEPVELTLVRDGREFAAKVPRRADDTPLKEERPADVSEVAPGIVYFNLDGAEYPAWQAALPKLDAARGVVLDLRGYPGGAGMQMLRHLTDRMIQSAKWQIPDCSLPDREGVVISESGRWKLQPAEPRLGDDGQKVVIITDGRAISYAESCMGIVEAYKLAEIVGGPTAGTNGNINPFAVCGGYYVVWTGMRVIKHDDSRHHGVGILPTVPAARTVEGISAGRDELLEAAIRAAGGAT